jgi:hypothetical protein
MTPKAPTGVLEVIAGKIMREAEAVVRDAQIFEAMFAQGANDEREVVEAPQRRSDDGHFTIDASRRGEKADRRVSCSSRQT